MLQRVLDTSETGQGPGIICCENGFYKTEGTSQLAQKLLAFQEDT